MNIRELKYLIALADHQHFGKAAQACFVSQPALSMQIKKLENTLGVTLIERNNKSFLLTEVGQLLSEKARTLLQQAQEIKDIATSFHNPFSGQLKLGVIPTIAPYLLPNLLPPFKKNFKQLQLFFIEEKTENLLQQLQSGKIDCALLASNDRPDFKYTPLFEDPFLLAVNKQHALAKYSEISFEKIKKESILLLEEGHCLSDQSKQACEYLHLSQFENFRASSLETLRYMVASGTGITLIPKLAQRKNDGLHYLIMRQKNKFKKDLSRQIYLSERPHNSRTILIKAIAECIRNLHQHG